MTDCRSIALGLLFTFLPNGAGLVVDDQERLAMLFPTDWSFKYFKETHPAVVLTDTPAIQSFRPS